MENRVVITGMGVVAPNGTSLAEFEDAIKSGKSGITFHQELEDLGFSCCIGGIPQLSESRIAEYLTPLQRRGFDSSGILYGCIAGIDAWTDAGLEVQEDGNADFDSGLVFGAGTTSVNKFRESIYKIDEKKVKRLGSTAVLQTMSSGVSAYLSGILGLGNQVTTNSSACTTGTEALWMGYNRIKSGQAQRMLVGSCSDSGPYIWGGFDAMRVMAYKYNDNPEAASRPMSASAAGFVPGSGAGALVLECLESAITRGAKIYAEVIGGAINCGGQRSGGSMTAPNPIAVQRCIRSAMADAGIKTKDIDTINGHLTATTKDNLEIENWVDALRVRGKDFPLINSLKSTVGHCLAASGSVECVATVLQVNGQYVFPNINCEDVNLAISDTIDTSCIPSKLIKKEVKIAVKASFGFGDVNGCVIFKKFKD